MPVGVKHGDKFFRLVAELIISAARTQANGLFYCKGHVRNLIVKVNLLLLLSRLFRPYWRYIVALLLKQKHKACFADQRGSAKEYVPTPTEERFIK